MTEFRDWIHALHTELSDGASPAMAQKHNQSQRSSPTTMTSHQTHSFSWSSADDTDSDSEREVGLFLHHASHLQRKTRKAFKSSRSFGFQMRANPVAIPARTHDFGWCDQDEVRDARAPCACGNECEQFFGDECDGCDTYSNLNQQRAVEDSQDLLFDMEL